MKQQFIDWAFVYVNDMLYYEDHGVLNKDTRCLMQQSMAAFCGNALTCYIAPLDKLTIILDLYSLLLGAYMTFSFMLIDGKIRPALTDTVQKPSSQVGQRRVLQPAAQE